MGICFYVTGFLKNTLCLPRPPSPPVMPLQRCQDWSLPSHHAVLNTNIPWFLWFYLGHHYSLSPLTKTIVFAGIAVWSFSVMFSRIYLGAHSPADILTGGVVGCILLAGWLQSYERIDDYLSSSPSLFSLVGLICIVVLLLSLHPDPHPVTIIFAETVCMTGAAVGFAVGQVLFSPPIGGRGLLEEAGQYSTIITAVGCCILRYIGGLVVLVALKTVAEKGAKIVFTAAARVAGVTTVCIKRKSEVTSERIHYSSSHFVVLSEMERRHKVTWVWDQRPVNIDIPVKFTSYTIMGVVAVAICPALFSFVNI